VAVAAAWPGGPLAFLPAILRWPLVAAAFGAAWPAWRGDGARADAVLEATLVALVLATYALLKVPAIHASWTDDGIYFHMAVRMTRGELPYRDFFFAHPPVHLVVPAIVFGPFGFSIGVAKAIPALAQGLAGALLWAALRRSSRLAAVAALVLHLTAYQVLMGSSDMDGENLATLLVCAGLFAAAAERPAVAGAMAGLAVGTVLYAAAGVGAVAVACALRGWRALGRFAAGVGATVAVVFGGAWAVGGRAFLDGVFGFHAAKAPDAGRAAVLGADGPAEALRGWLGNVALDLTGPAALRSTYFHAPVLVAAALGAAALVAVVARRDGPPRRERLAPGTPEAAAAVALAGVALFAVQGGALPERYPFYDVPAFPFLATLGGYGALAAWRAIASGASPPRTRSWAAAALAAFAVHPLLAAAVQGRAFPEERARRGEEVGYPWRDPEALAGVARASRMLLWSGRRTAGEVEPPYRHYLWNKTLAFSTAGEIAEHVRAGSSPGETLAGASTMAPLVALLADRRLAAGEVDTNHKRFATGSLDEDAYLSRILADRVRFLLAAPRSHFTEERIERDPRWTSHFVRDRVFEDPALSRAGPVRVVLYRRREEVR
jgi:hypothetical protein